MCGDSRCYSPAVVEELQEISRQCADEQLLRDLKRILSTPQWQTIKCQPMYAGLHDIAILSDVVTASAIAVEFAFIRQSAGIEFHVEEFGGRNANTR